MKRLIYIIICASVLAMNALAQNQLMLVYHGDSNTDFDAFLFNEIDSIRYSNIGLDSISYSEVMTQEIWTADSVYRYALAEIDSINFQSPPTIVKDGAINLADDIEQYIVSSDSSTILFSSSTPDHVLPKVGNKLYAIMPSEKLPYGFIGEVATINATQDGMEISCTEIEMADVFEQFYGGITSISRNPAEAETKMTANDIGISLAPDVFESDLLPFSKDFKFDIEKNKDVDLSKLPFGTLIKESEYSNECALDCSITINPHVKVSSIWVINPLTVYTRTVTSFNADYTLSITGKLASEFNIKFKPFHSFNLPTGAGTKLNVPIGFFFGGDITAGVEYNYSNTIKWFSDVAVTRPILLPVILPEISGNCKVSLADGNHALDCSLSGAIRAGLYLDPGIAWLQEDVIKIGGEANVGVELSGKSLFLTTDLIDAKNSLRLYHRLLEEGGVSLSLYASAQCKVTVLGKDFDIGAAIEGNIGATLFTTNAVPEFSAPSFTDHGDGSASISYSTDGVCLMPKKVGIIVRDKTGMTPPQTIYFDEKYFSREASYSRYSLTFDYDKNKQYTISPITEISPIYGYIMCSPAWPPLDGNIFYPFIYHYENQVSGIRATSGMPNIESGADNGTSVQEGNYFPFNAPPQEEEEEK